VAIAERAQTLVKRRLATAAIAERAQTHRGIGVGSSDAGAEAWASIWADVGESTSTWDIIIFSFLFLTIFNDCGCSVARNLY